MLGALAFSAEQLEIELNWIDEHVDGKPYGVDVVMPAKLAEGAATATKDQLEAMIPAQHREFIETTLREYAVPPLPEGVAGTESLLGWVPSGGQSQVDVALRHPIRLLVNALGPPPADVVERAHRHNIPVAALVGSPEHAMKQVEAGVDIIVASGTEAGGHTGEIATMVLVPQVVDAVGPDTPVLAAGGIASGRQIAAALALGADGAWTGSVWLTTKESDLHPVVVEKVLQATSRDTVRSRSMTGKPARQLRTGWTDAWDAPTSPGTLPMPLQFMATAEAISRIHRNADNPQSRARELVGTPIGQVAGMMRSVRPVRDVIYDMVQEYVATVERLSR